MFGLEDCEREFTFRNRTGPIALERLQGVGLSSNGVLVSWVRRVAWGWDVVGGAVGRRLSGVRGHLSRTLSGSFFGSPRFSLSSFRPRIYSVRERLGRVLRFGHRRLRFPRLRRVYSVRGGVGRIGSRCRFCSPRCREDIVFPGNRSRRRSSFTFWV